MTSKKLRDIFEQKMYARYLKERSERVIAGDRDELLTIESLVWRHPEGRYGVNHVEHAWQGFLMALDVQCNWPVVGGMVHENSDPRTE